MQSVSANSEVPGQTTHLGAGALILIPHCVPRPIFLKLKHYPLTDSKNLQCPSAKIEI